MLIICLGYGITITTACIIYYYCACITIVHIIASFILPLTRSLSDDPEFARPGWRSQILSCQTFHWIHIGLVIDVIPRYLYYLVFSSLYFHISISIMIPNSFLQVFLYFFNAGTLVYMEVISCTEA